jgi:DNA-binding CsgD family transcriptional regulator
VVNGSIVEQKISRLSEGQRICLRLVNTHHSSKQIARMLNISRHTVDQRLALACKTLELSSRRDAARLFAQYDSVVYEPIDIGSTAEAAPSLPNSNSRERDASDTVSEYLREEAKPFYVDADFRSGSIKPPFPLQKGQANDLSIKQRLIWIAVIFGASILISGLLIVALEALGRLL